MIFKYPDTNSSRANIEYLNCNFSNQKVAIIGLGGTGSYILDFLAKTPVSEIHLYDSDIFQVHNAFRAPGAISSEDMLQNETLRKVDYYHKVYSKMHNFIFAHGDHINMENIDQLSDKDFVFICVDKNKVRSFISKKLLKFGVPFIDVGMGVNSIGDHLIGSVRVTYGSKDKHDHLYKRFGEEEFEDNDYTTNIQIAELNCLNAVMAIIKWKKTIGFYQDLKGEHNSLFFINTNKFLNEDYKI